MLQAGTSRYGTWENPRCERRVLIVSCKAGGDGQRPLQQAERHGKLCALQRGSIEGIAHTFATTLRIRMVTRWRRTRLCGKNGCRCCHLGCPKKPTRVYSVPVVDFCCCYQERCPPKVPCRKHSSSRKGYEAPQLVKRLTVWIACVVNQ